jgi:rhodanese-related sulfurtransferase
MKMKFVVLVALFLAACSNNASHTGTKPAAGASQNESGSAQASVMATYSPAQTLELIKQKKDLLIIDVRSPGELREGKIENSTLIPFMDIMRGKYTIPHGRPLLLICAVGGRSYAAMQILAQSGYSEVYNLKGGIDAWKQARLPLVY